jgi:hypothetical protein
MEVPGRDVNADSLGPEPTGAPGAEGHEGHEGGERGEGHDGGLMDKIKRAAEKAKDAVTPHHGDR